MVNKDSNTMTVDDSFERFYQRNFMTRRSNIDRIREHQANERAFLAWLRTSLALIGFGFAIARFSIFLRQLQASVTQQEPIPLIREFAIY
jgi:putative membrane protein